MTKPIVVDISPLLDLEARFSIRSRSLCCWCCCAGEASGGVDSAAVAWMMRWRERERNLFPHGVAPLSRADIDDSFQGLAPAAGLLAWSSPGLPPGRENVQG